MFQRLLCLPGKALQRRTSALVRTGQALLRDMLSHSDPRMLALIGLCGLLFSVAFVQGTPHAFAAQSAPPYAESYYVTSTSTSAAYTHGCSQGQADAHWKSSSMAILDFGGQVNGSTVDNWDAGDISNGTIAAEAEAFADGYWNCTGSDSTTVLRLAIGTNNSVPGGTSPSTGADWASLAASVQSYDQSHGYSSQVIVMGANDLEPSWGTASGADNWAGGYSNADSGTYYVNFGSADGCPTNASDNAACNNGWHQYDLWYISWGASAAIATPQIYSTTLAWQWQQISLYGYLHQGGAIRFEGPMAEQGTISTSSAWSDFWNALNSDSRTAQNMNYLLNIAWAW